MTKRMKLVLAVGGGLVVCAVILIAGLFVLVWLLPDGVGTVAEGFDPKCPDQDELCLAWSELRNSHPYPYQTVAAKRLADGTFAIIVSEPPPTILPSELDRLTRSIFGAETKLARHRWKIGADGWVEDVVFAVKPSASGLHDPLDDPLLRDRVAALEEVLYGTAFGGDLEIVRKASGPVAGHPAPNLAVSPAEAANWLAGDTTRWRSVDASGPEGVTWADLRASSAIGAFTSEDGALAMLTFPTRFLDEARARHDSLEPLRVPFRKFAVVSEAIFGSVWSRDGQTAILARVRTQPLNVIPALRFETFQMLASQTTDELAQSYERNTVLAGKLGSGDYQYKDWAPVYLSAPLIDTEFGALLNVTDQMLKSWSEAGNVEYLYFNYPKPADYPFQKVPLSKVLAKKHGSTSVLFNWNTAGSAVVVRGPEFSTLTAQWTGALPVTYGANGKSKAEGGKDVFEYEEKAYRYFSGLRDPNLARVVQYTLMYQTFRAIAKEAGDISSPSRTAIPQRTQSADVLVRETRSLLEDIDQEKVTKPAELVANVRTALGQFHSAFPHADNTQLATLLTDRSAPILMDLIKQRQNDLTATAQNLDGEEKQLKAEVADYNQRVQATLANVLAANDETVSTLNNNKSSLNARRVSLEERAAAFKHDYEAFGVFTEKPRDAIDSIREPLFQVGVASWDLDRVRLEFVKANNATPPPAAIKTPSIVLSWNRKDLLESIGGHNVKAATVLLEETSAVKGIEVVEDAAGHKIIRYDAAHASEAQAHANDLARAVDHRGITDATELMSIAGTPTRIRPRIEALDFRAGELAENSFGRLGERVYETKKPFVDDLRKLAEGNDCCIFVARDEKQIAYLAEPHPKPPPAIRTVEIRDTPSLVEHLAGWSKKAGIRQERAVIFLNEPESHVQALAMDVTDGTGRINRIVEAVGEKGGRAKTNSVAGIVESDIDGKRSVLRTLSDAIGTKSRAALEAIGIPIPKQMWRHAVVTPFEGEGLAQVLGAAKWNPATDGIPTAIRMSFTKKLVHAPDVAIVAGFGSDAGNALATAARTHAVDVAALDSATLAKYLMTVRSRLSALPGAQLKRLYVVVEDDSGRTILTRLDLGMKDSKEGV